MFCVGLHVSTQSEGKFEPVPVHLKHGSETASLLRQVSECTFKIRESQYQLKSHFKGRGTGADWDREQSLERSRLYKLESFPRQVTDGHLLHAALATHVVT